MSSSCVAILPSLIFLREKGLFSELLAAMLSSVIRKERCAHDPFFVLKLGTADGNNFEKAHLTFEIVYLNVLPWPF